MFGIGKKDDETSTEEAPKAENPTLAADAAAPTAASAENITSPPSESSETPAAPSASELPPQTEPSAPSDAGAAPAAPETLPPIEEPPPVIDPAKLDEATSQALGSDHFADWIGENILRFLAIMEIENNGQRRAALLSFNLGEEGIKKRLAIASALMLIKTEYGMASSDPEIVKTAKKCISQIDGMRAWLTL